MTSGSRAFECSGTSGCDPAALTYRKYYYDGLGRLVGTDERVPASAPADYFPDYDPLGRLVQAPDNPVSLGYDGDNVVRTNYDSAATNWTFVHGPNLDDPLIGHYVRMSAGTVQFQTTVYFATDGQGRQYAVADSNGRDVSGDLDYVVRGGKYAGGTLNAASFSADRSSPASMKQLSFFRNRFYDQASGRWTQEDPIGVAGGVNLYQFNGNNPVSNTDPFGLSPNDCCDELEGAAIGGGIGATIGGIVALGCAAGSGGVCAAGAPAIITTFGGIGASVGGLIGSIMEASGNSGKDAPGQTAAGKATDSHGNPLGPSGKPQVDNVNKSTRKEAKDAARNAGKGTPTHHPSPARGKPHYQPTDAGGNKVPGSPHYTYPR